MFLRHNVSGHGAPLHSGLFRAHVIEHRHPALASGRSSHTTRQRSLTFFPRGVLFGKRPDKGFCPCHGPSRATRDVAADRLASGRPLRNNAQAKFPPISQRVFHSASDPRRGFVPVMVHRVRRVMWWLTDWCQAGHYTQRESEVSPASRKGISFSERPDEGSQSRLCM